MTDQSPPQTSFSAARRWGIRLDYALRTALVLAVVVMVNYLGARWHYRAYLSAQTRQPLSPLTIGLLRSLTNDVKVTLFYDREDPLFTTVAGLLADYRDVNPRVSVTAVDYRWDAAEAQRVLGRYRDALTGVTNKNLIIFDCAGRVKVVNGNALAEYVPEYLPETLRDESGSAWRRKPVAFLGEKMFTAALLAVTSARQFQACFLTGHGEHSLADAGDTGYRTFASVLHQNYIRTDALSLVGTNAVPGDCDLLVIAGPAIAIPTNELEKVQQYLLQGGRLLALCNPAALGRETGLERLLARWNVIIGNSAVRDEEQSETGRDVVVSAYAPHPLVSSLVGYAIYLAQPREISVMEPRSRDAGVPRVQPVCFTGERAYLADDPRGPRRRYAVAAAVENAVPGVVTERGTTRILVVGDSLCFDNQCIEKWANRDFAAAAVNWLLERSQLLEGVGPRPVQEFRVTMTRAQVKTVRWILLAALPGAVLSLGGLVWLRRRT
jgi:hypothetical protein